MLAEISQMTRTLTSNDPRYQISLLDSRIFVCGPAGLTTVLGMLLIHHLLRHSDQDVDVSMVHAVGALMALGHPKPIAPTLGDWLGKFIE